MMLIENVNILRQRFGAVLQLMKDLEGEKHTCSSTLEVLPSKSGMSTIKWNGMERPVFIHSQYDPVHEAERFIEQFNDLDSYDHVLFYGVGFGYHVEAFMKLNPRFTFSLYEPNPYIMHEYLSHRQLSTLPLKSLKNVYVHKTRNETDVNLSHFMSQMLGKRILLVILPSYERIFQKETEQFIASFKEVIHRNSINFSANASYQMRWTINSMVNITKVLKTDNILLQKSRIFKGKPVILVAAGPSLQEEIENLRYIKQHGLAYIFSVGSAINALIENNIYPDATCSYDPNPWNQMVLQKVIDRKIDSIPLIFGSSVGYETLQHYPGPMLHMITGQDTISPVYLFENPIQSNEMVSDAPTIAIVTLELLYKLGVSQIILVGQNFAFKNNQYYSEGISYESQTNKLSEKQKENIIFVQAADGGEVATSMIFKQSREQMEAMISALKGVEVINTTRGGAKIHGTKFMELSRVIRERLAECIVDMEWYKREGNFYPYPFVAKQFESMEEEYRRFLDIMESLVRKITQMEKLVEGRVEQKLLKVLNSFDKLFKKLRVNRYYATFVFPATRVHIQFLERAVREIRAKTNIIEKCNEVILKFGKYLYECQLCAQVLEGIYPNMCREVLRIVNDNNVGQETVTCKQSK